jgi:methyl-accepting chemotaxis protein
MNVLDVIKNLKLRSKLALMLAVPILGILFMTGSQILDKKSMASDMSQMQELAALSTTMNAVLHESQKERGRTGQYLGSGGTKWSSELSAQRQLLDTKINDLNDFLGGFDSANFGNEFVTNFSAATRDIDGVASHRRTVDGVPASSVGLGYYTKMNSKILSLTTFAAKLTDDRELADRIHAFANLSLAKEQMGQERAVMSGAFGRGAFDAEAGDFNRFGQLVTAQDMYLHSFDTFATEEQNAFFNSTVRGSAVNKVTEWEQLAFDSGGIGDLSAVTSGEWFDGIIAKINLMKTVEDQLGVNLVSKASVLASDARSSLITTILFGLAILAAAGVGAFFIAQALTGPLGQVRAVATELAKGDVDQEITVDSSDEVGQMASSFKEMIAYMKEMAGAAELIAAGDLTVEVKPKSDKDALGNSFLMMVENLRNVISDVATTADGLTDASDQLSSAANQAGQATQGIAATSQEVAKGADEQARSVEQTQRSIGELSSAVNEIATGSTEQQVQVAQAMDIVKQVSESADSVAQNAQVAANGASDVNEAARNGQEMMRDTIDGIRGIETAVGSVSELGKQSAEIGKIIGVIDDIADQTNLLALNAAIEAARAGDQGRGFAVVADEVRQLAERVTEATKEIAVLIEVVQTAVEDSMKATEEGSEQVTEGVERAEKAAGALQQIIDSVSEVTGQIEQISAGAEEVSASGDEMVRTVESVAGISERNAASAEQMRSSSSNVEQAISGIAAIAEQSTASAQEASAGAEEMSAQVEEVVASSETLAGMAQGLKKAVGTFQIGKGKAPGASPA